MLGIVVQNRPFAVDARSGLMLFDGIFDTSVADQLVTAQFTNAGPDPLSGSTVYLESVSDPAVTVVHDTHPLGELAAGATRVVGWHADFRTARPGSHRVSFVVQRGAVRQRIIKKIFVVGVEFDPASRTFRGIVPQGVLEVRFTQAIEPADGCCGKEALSADVTSGRAAAAALRTAAVRGRGGEGCVGSLFPVRFESAVMPVPAYPGQYGDLPFDDPWWKVVLAILGALFTAASAYVKKEELIVKGSGTFDETVPEVDCCKVKPKSAESTDSYVAAGLAAAAAACYIAAALSDARDPFRRGQDNTPPGAGEMTVRERLEGVMYPDGAVEFGQPFPAIASWRYTRDTSSGSRTFEVRRETNANVHLLREYRVIAPDVVRLYRKERFRVTAEFLDLTGERVRGGRLYVQCVLTSAAGELHRFFLQDDGVPPDNKPDDGLYTAEFDFGWAEMPEGVWRYMVIAQDVNTATADLSPEKAAELIGGVVLTNQLTVTFSGGECALVPDGHVQVIR